MHVQKLINESRKSEKPEINPMVKYNNYPLRGLITCGQCGSTYTTTYTRKNGTMHRYYICGKRSKEGKQCCDAPILGAKAVETHLANEIKDICDSAELQQALHEIISEYNQEIVDDCLFNMDILLTKLSDEQLAELFDAVYERIVFDPAQSAFLLTRRTL